MFLIARRAAIKADSYRGWVEFSPWGLEGGSKVVCPYEVSLESGYYLKSFEWGGIIKVQEDRRVKGSKKG